MSTCLFIERFPFCFAGKGKPATISPSGSPHSQQDVPLRVNISDFISNARFFRKIFLDRTISFFTPFNTIKLTNLMIFLDWQDENLNIRTLKNNNNVQKTATLFIRIFSSFVKNFGNSKFDKSSQTRSHTKPFARLLTQKTATRHFEAQKTCKLCCISMNSLPASSILQC